MTDEYEVRWFRENTIGAVEDLGLGNPDTLLGMEWISRYHNIAFRNQQYSPSLLGKYWCQMITTADHPDQPLMRSNVFTLLAPGNYSGPACTLVQEVGNMTCADLPANQPVGMTTTTVPVPVPTTTTLMAPIQTPAASSSPSSTPFPTTQDQISPFLYVIASIGGGIFIFLITIIVLIVVITVMRLKKRGTDHKGIA